MTAATPLAMPPAPTFMEALRFWFKLGFISFGGPAGQIAIMHQELVERRRWISEHRFLHALNYCMLLPGPEACQLAIYTGWLLHGLRGGLMAGLLFFLPAFFLLSLLAGLYLAFGDLPLVQGVFYGIKPAVVAVVLFAAWRIGSRAIKNGMLLAICAAAFVGIFFFGIGFPWIVLAAGILGAIGGKLLPAKFSGGGGHGGGQQGLWPGADRRRHTAAAARKVLLGKAGGDHVRFCRPRRGILAGACAAMPTSTTWASSSPRRPSSPSAAPMPCCPTSIRAGSSISPGSPARR
jgi:chromate transport protein ChrA